MKNGKKPTLAQKKLLKLKGLVPENWIIVKDTTEFMEVVSRMELKKIGLKKVKTKRLYKDAFV
ncbi:MAG: hypothetical protein LBQ71_12575 [Hungatella sp.]|jgi:hypothetical protein|nr:hypothetical protein [Hungatella sp.]